jgi:hypothetical protein
MSTRTQNVLVILLAVVVLGRIALMIYQNHHR